MGLLGVAALPPAAAAPAFDADAAFAARSLAEAVAALGGAPLPTTQIALQIPDVADNGAVVPVIVTSSLPGTHEIFIVVDGNPQPVAARFTIPAGTEPFVATRIKMAQSGTVYAAARTDGGLYAVARTVRVTVGGCG